MAESTRACKSDGAVADQLADAVKTAVAHAAFACLI